MAKRNTTITLVKIDKWLKEGRGQGEGKDYKPWLTIRDVPSEGVVIRSKGWKTGRIHHFLSQLETHYFYTLEWSDEVVDIREQYPLLPLERTVEIAESLGIKHPVDPKTQELNVMTTDFLVTVMTQKGKELRARTIKPSTKLSERNIEKFAIEQQYYAEQNIDWAIVTESDKPEAFIRNIDWLYNAKDIENIAMLNEDTLNKVSLSLLKEISNRRSDPLSLITLDCDEKFGFNHGTCLFIVKHMIANKKWVTNMHKDINPLSTVLLNINLEKENTN